MTRRHPTWTPTIRFMGFYVPREKSPPPSNELKGNVQRAQPLQRAEKAQFFDRKGIHFRNLLYILSKLTMKSTDILLVPTMIPIL